ncbi:hypothetical protein T265_12832, partial [Opisthorchis viverrini]
GKQQDCTSQPNNLNHDVHHGAVQKPKYFSAVMVRRWNTRFDSIPAIVPLLLCLGPLAHWSPCRQTQSTFICPRPPPEGLASMRKLSGLLGEMMDEQHPVKTF